MAGTTFSLKQIIMLLFGLLAIVMILDFSISGKTYEEEVITVNKNKEKYYNAAQNSHYSYTVKTAMHSFSVSENFASQLNENQKLNIKTSLLFDKVNTAEIIATGKTETYSLRLLSGLVFPLIALIILALGYIQPNKRGVLLYVTKVLLIANLVFLLFF